MTDAPETNPTPNPFDNLSALRLDQSYADTVGVKKLYPKVPVTAAGHSKGAVRRLTLRSKPLASTK